MNHIEAKIENLQRQMLIASDRISKLENFTQPLAHPPDQNQCYGMQEPDSKCDTKPANSPHQKELDVYERTIARLGEHGDHLETKITTLKSERNDQGKEIVELKKELAALKANNRYQAGHTDGANMILKQVREMAAKLKA